MSYETTEDSLLELFSQFGKVSYAKVVVNPLTERSKGIAFVQFLKKEDADKCLEKAEDPLKVTNHMTAHLPCLSHPSPEIPSSIFDPAMFLPSCPFLLTGHY